MLNMLKTVLPLLLREANLWQLLPNDTKLTFSLLPLVFSDVQRFVPLTTATKTKQHMVK